MSKVRIVQMKFNVSAELRQVIKLASSTMDLGLSEFIESALWQDENIRTIADEREIVEPVRPKREEYKRTKAHKKRLSETMKGLWE